MINIARSTYTFVNLHVSWTVGLNVLCKLQMARLNYVRITTHSRSAEFTYKRGAWSVDAQHAKRIRSRLIESKVCVI